MKKNVIAVILGVIITVGAVLLVRYKMKKDLNYWYKIAIKNDALLKLTAKWAEKESRGESLANILLNKGYKNIAIYGYGIVGERLCGALKQSGVCVKCAVDKSADEKLGVIPIVKPDEVCQDFDALIVTAVKDYNSIKEEMQTKLSCPIISLEDLIYEN